MLRLVLLMELADGTCCYSSVSVVSEIILGMTVVKLWSHLNLGLDAHTYISMFVLLHPNRLHLNKRPVQIKYKIRQRWNLSTLTCSREIQINKYWMTELCEYNVLVLTFWLLALSLFLEIKSGCTLACDRISSSTGLKWSRCSVFTRYHGESFYRSLINDGLLYSQSTCLSGSEHTAARELKTCVSYLRISQPRI